MRHLIALLFVSLLATPATGQLIPDDAELEKVADGYQFTEGPAAGPDDCIYFTDIPAELILKYDPESGETETYQEQTSQANGLMFDARGDLFRCVHGSRSVYVLRQVEPNLVGPGISIEPLSPPRTALVEPSVFTPGMSIWRYEGKQLNSPNDLDIDRAGNVYFTDPRYGNRDSMEIEIEGVYFQSSETDLAQDPAPDSLRLKPLARIIDDLTRPNGIVLSPDESILYVADHGTNEIFAYDIEAPGEIDNKRLFARLNDGEGRGGPDGLCVDAQGRVYAAGQNRIWIYNPDGSAAGDISVGPACTNCTFANDGKTLYITANRGLYRVELNTDEPAPGSDDE